MRHLSPQTFLLLVAALALLLGGGLWWASRQIRKRALRAAQPLRTLRKQPAPLHRAAPSVPSADPVAPLPLAAMEVAVSQPAPLVLPEEQPAGAKILRRDRGFSSANQPALRSGSHASLHVEARRQRPIA